MRRHTGENSSLPLLCSSDNFIGKGGRFRCDGRRGDKRQNNGEKQAIDMVGRDSGQNAIVFRHRIAFCQKEAFAEKILTCL